MPKVRIVFLLAATVATTLVFWMGINGTSALHGWIAANPEIVKRSQPWLFMCTLICAAFVALQRTRTAE